MHFILSLCQPPIYIFYSAATLQLPSFRITHLLLKQFPISIHILFHLPSKLFIYFLFALIYIPFNISLLFFVRFHTSFFCLFVARCQHFLSSSLFSLNCSFYLSVSPQLSLSHTLLLQFLRLPILPAPTYDRHYYLHPILLP